MLTAKHMHGAKHCQGISFVIAFWTGVEITSEHGEEREGLKRGSIGTKRREGSSQ
jgi:hypothetical protein